MPGGELRLHRSLRRHRWMLIPFLLLGYGLGFATYDLHVNPLRDELAAMEQRLPLPKGFLVSPLNQKDI